MQYSPSVPQTQLPESSSTSPTNKNHTGTDLSLAESLQHIKNESLCHEFSALHSTQTSTEKVFETKGIGQRADSTASNFPLNQSPRLAELLLPDTDLDSVPFDYVDNGLQYQPFGYIVPLPDELPDSEEVWRKPNLSPQARVSRLSSHSPSASSWSSSADNLLFDPVRCIYAQPKLHPASPEMLMLGFDTQTCGILSVKDGPTENPWRTLVWPLAQECPALYHAISSMTAFHTSKLKPMLKVEGMEHMRRSIRHLASGIENMRIDTALATTLVLAFSESWDVHVSTGIKHLRGAKVLVNQALTRHSHNSLNGEDFVRLKFLHNTWIYMDVIARLTNVDEDESSDLDLTMWHSLNGFGTSTEVDPLMGCACTLFPLIGSVANLVRRVRKSDSNSINIISQANDLKTLVETWEPPMFFEPPEDPTSEIQDSLQTAEAYRWATLLYLHQAVPEIPSLSATQLAKKALVYLATVPSSSRAIIVQIYPLLAAGCEASSAEDRAWVEERWRLMSQRMLIGNVDRCLEVVKEVWRRRDAYEAERFQHQSRRAASRMSSYLGSPVASIKRAFSVDEHRGSALSFDWTDSFGGLKRRITEADSGLSTPVRINRGHRNSFDMLENIEFEKTVRGRLHWVGVMKDWDWEGKHDMACQFALDSNRVIVLLG